VENKEYRYVPPTSDPKVLFNEVSALPESAVPTKDPIAFHRKLPRYERTPLYSVPALAERLGIGEVVVKDESVRLGLPAF
jgi:diaminopropionate ammonia-lyase